MLSTITIGHLFGIRHRPKGRELTCIMSLCRSCLTWSSSMRRHKQSTLHGRSVALTTWLSNLSIRGWKLMVLMVGHGQCSNGLCIADKINSPLQMEIHTENISGRQPLQKPHACKMGYIEKLHPETNHKLLTLSWLHQFLRSHTWILNSQWRWIKQTTEHRTCPCDNSENSTATEISKYKWQQRTTWQNDNDNANSENSTATEIPKCK